MDAFKSYARGRCAGRTPGCECTAWVRHGKYALFYGSERHVEERLIMYSTAG